MSDNKLTVGSSVTGKFGPLIRNPNAVAGKPHRRVRDYAVGTIVVAVDRLWDVRSDHDSVLRNMQSSQLQIAEEIFGLPLDEPPIKESSCYCYV